MARRPLYAQGTVNAPNLTTLTDGSNADALHTHDLGEGGSGVLIAGEPVLFSSADLQALHLTRKTLIPAQGANTLIVPFRLIYRYHAGATPYTSAPGNTLYPQYGAGDVNVSPATQPSADFLTLETNQTIVSGSFDDLGTLNDLPINSPLTLIADSALTAGNGTMTVTPLFFVLDTSA